MNGNIRPQGFADFTGQDAVKGVLQTAVTAARKRGDPMDHILLTGPPGLGKTTLAQIAAREMGSNIKIVAAPSLEKKQVIPLLRSLQRNDVLFLDEAHCLAAGIEELFLGAMEDFELRIAIASRVVRIPLQKFTLIAATTKPASISAPLKSRFGLTLRLEYYSPADLAAILLRSARAIGVEIEPQAALLLGKCSKGVPRIGNALLQRARDLAELRDGKITAALAQETVAKLGIDERGLDKMDRKLLEALIRAGRPLGLQAIATMLSEEEETVETMEGFLMRSGLMVRTERGRIALPAAFRHLGINRFAVHVF